MLKKDIAVLLSTGKFDEGYPHLSEHIRWDIVNDRVFNGLDEVKKYFDSVSAYFESVSTDFKVDEVIESENKVVVTGTAVFSKDNKRVNEIEACDVYSFKNDKVTSIKPFCIPLDKEKM